MTVQTYFIQSSNERGVMLPTHQKQVQQTSPCQTKNMSSFMFWTSLFTLTFTSYLLRTASKLVICELAWPVWEFQPATNSAITVTYYGSEIFTFSFFSDVMIILMVVKSWMFWIFGMISMMILWFLYVQRNAHVVGGSKQAVITCYHLGTSLVNPFMTVMWAKDFTS